MFMHVHKHVFLTNCKIHKLEEEGQKNRDEFSRSITKLKIEKIKNDRELKTRKPKIPKIPKISVDLEIKIDPASCSSHIRLACRTAKLFAG